MFSWGELKFQLISQPQERLLLVGLVMALTTQVFPCSENLSEIQKQWDGSQRDGTGLGFWSQQCHHLTVGLSHSDPWFFHLHNGSVPSCALSSPGFELYCPSSWRFGLYSGCVTKGSAFRPGLRLRCKKWVLGADYLLYEKFPTLPPTLLKGLSIEY